MPEICRMCSKNSTLLVPMLESSKNKHELEEIGSQFEDCFGIKVLAIPDYTSICSLCHKKLCCFYEFKREVLKTHEKLLERYKGIFLEEKDIKSEILDDLDVEYFEDDGTCRIFQKLDEAYSKESIKVQSVTDLPDVILPKETVKPRQIPSPIIKIEGLREKMISLEKDKEKEEDEQDDENDDEFDEIQDDELEEIERISLGDLENLSDDGDYNPDKTLEDTSKKSKDGEDNFRCYKCHVCKQMFYNKKVFEVHMLKYEQQHKSESSSSRSSILEVKKAKKTKYKINCDQCEKTFALEETFRAHINTHRGLPAYSCNICGKGFNQKVSFVYHMKNHNNERSFECEICSKAFLGKGDLQIHMRSHNDDRPYVCHICGKRYKLLTNIKEHSETHVEENLFECKICKKKLHSRQTLRGHIAAMHENCDPRLYCTLCKKQFNRRHRFISHVKIKHPDDNEEMLSKVERRVMNKFPREKYQKLEKNK